MGFRVEPIMVKEESGFDVFLDGFQRYILQGGIVVLLILHFFEELSLFCLLDLIIVEQLIR
jgi:hypothetical protein